MATTLLSGLGRSDPFYAFHRFQQDAAKDWTATPVIGGANGYLENNQDAAYNRLLASLGVKQTDNSPYAQFLRNQFANTQLGYRTALAEDPTLLYQDYLTRAGLNAANINNWNGQYRQQFLNQSPQQRGEYKQRYVGPTRTIADI